MASSVPLADTLFDKQNLALGYFDIVPIGIKACDEATETTSFIVEMVICAGKDLDISCLYFEEKSRYFQRLHA